MLNIAPKKLTPAIFCRPTASDQPEDKMVCAPTSPNNLNAVPSFAISAAETIASTRLENYGNGSIVVDANRSPNNRNGLRSSTSKMTAFEASMKPLGIDTRSCKIYRLPEGT
jgi:hypothetical protein